MSGRSLTRKRIRTVIKEEFGVECDVSQVGRILDQIGWSRQKPDHRSDRRDEEAIEEWREEEWPRIKKAETEAQALMFADEAGFYQLPATVRTWAPRGELPEGKRQSFEPCSTTIISQLSAAPRGQASFTYSPESSRPTGRKLYHFSATFSERSQES
ncbi:winged helix-turn-helix domain-containing protein [Salinibacter ruber]|uniref:winged helix-turn-helix domain-containing protein n=1 Tax=Salinibacter ruber TaxID=146919 RepID=UPI003C6E8D16